MALALETQQDYNGREIVVERPDGRRVTVLAHANPIRDEAGRLCGAVNVLVDITDRKEIEQKLREADRSKDEFLATLAHELRNPLAPARNAVHILQMEELPSGDSRWALEVLERQIQQMSRLIDDLMDVARITRNRLELRKERVELAQVIHRAVETSEPLIEASGHALEITLPSPLLAIDADPTRLAQAIANLLGNAAKYMDRGGRIWLGAELGDDHVSISVRDTGIGIASEMLPRIFDLFAHAEPAPGRAQGGLGIGLTLVKRLVELHGGSVAAHSDGPGTGSEFTIRLPIGAAPMQEPHSAEVGRPPTARRLRILVVDDNVDAAESLGTFLQLVGNEIRVVHGGLEAPAAAEEFHPDVGLLDIGLPGLDGYEVAKRIRRQPGGSEIILIAVTGWGQDADRQRSKEAGFDHHRVKPVDPAELLRLLDAVTEDVASRR